MSDRRHVDAPAEPARVVRDFLEAGKQALAEERLTEAVKTLEAALGLCATIRDSEGLSIEVMEALVPALHRAGRLADGLALQRRVVSWYQAHRPEDSKHHAAMAALALLCHGAGRAEEASALIDRLVTALDAISSDEPTLIAQAGAFGQVLLESSVRLDAAEHLLRRAIEGVTAQLGRDEAAELMVALADVLDRTGQDDEALALAEEALPLLEAEPTPRRELGRALMLVGRGRLADERFDEAEALFKRGEAVYLAVGGTGSPHAVGCSFHLAVTYRDRGDDERAEALFPEVLRRSKETFGPNHPAVANVAEAYAELLEALGRDEEAEALMERVRVIRGEEDDESDEDEDEEESNAEA